MNPKQPNIQIPQNKVYKVYTSLVSQQTTNAPTEHLLQNNTGRTLTWSRTDVGQYIGTLTGPPLDQNKLSITISPYNAGNSAGYYAPQQIFIATFNIAAATYADGQLQFSQFEMRIYT